MQVAHGQKSKAKDILVEIIRQAGGTFDGKTRLYKTFYFAHLYYYRDTPAMLSDWPIVHMPHGPGIDAGDILINELISAGRIRAEQVSSGPYVELRLSLLSEEPTSLDAAERSAIAEAVRFIEGQTATALSDLIHEHSRSWIQGRSGRPLNVYIDVIPETDYEQDLRELDGIRQDIAAAFRD